MTVGKPNIAQTMLFYEYKNAKISLKTQGIWHHINKSKEEVHLCDGYIMACTEFEKMNFS